MEGINLYLLGWDLVFSIDVIMMLLLGVVIGVIVGALPGLTATMSVAIIVPLTFDMNVQMAFALIMGAYTGGVYGGSMSAVLADIPGTPAAIMTRLDGYPMGRQGKGGLAIGYATIASFFGGLISIIFLVILAPIIARMALKFSAEEYFAVALLGLSIIAYVSSKGTIIKGLISGLLGLLLAAVGMDPMTAYPRFTMGIAEILSGFELLPILIGIFGLGNIFMILEKDIHAYKITEKVSRVLITFKEFKQILPTILRASPIGVIIGAIPAAGATIACIVAYGFEKRISPRSEEFGTGLPEGIVAPEAANNASIGGALIPLLSLGIPGDSVGAILIGALMIHGLTPGPLLFKENPEIVSSIFILITLATFAFLFVGLGMAKIIGKIMKLPYGILLPSIFLFCIVGSYAIRNSFFDVWVMFIFGILGYIFNKIRVPLSPLVLGFVLGPLVENNLRRALMISGGDITTFIRRPISLVLLFANFILLFLPYIITIFHNIKGKLLPYRGI
jgi:putative tricarboxylic transport membrane protein